MDTTESSNGYQAHSAMFLSNNRVACQSADGSTHSGTAYAVQTAWPRVLPSIRPGAHRPR